MGLERIGKGIKYIFILNFFQIMATLIFYYITTSILSENEIGITAILTFIYTTLSTLSPLAIPTAGAKYVAELIGKGEIQKASATAKTVVKLVFMSSTAIIIIIYTMVILIIDNTESYTEIIIPFSLICLGAFLASLKFSYLGLVQGLQLYDRYVLINTSTTIVSHLAGILLISQFRLIGFSTGILIGEINGLALALIFYHGQLPKATQLYDYRTLLRFSIPIFIMQIATVFSDWMDRILAFIVSLNLSLLGILELTVRSASSLLIIGGFVEAIMLPIFSKTYGQAEEKDITLFLKKSARYLGFIYFPAAFGLAAISRTVMVLLYGEIYSEGSIPLAMLSISSTFTAFSGLVGTVLKAIDKTKIFIKIAVISLLIDATLVITLTPFLGILGATIARSSTSFLVLVLLFFELKQSIKVEVDIDGLWKGLIGSTILAALMVFFDRFYLNTTLISLLYEVIFGVIAYPFILIILKALRNEDFYVFRQIIPKLSKLIDFIENTISRFIE